MPPPDEQDGFDLRWNESTVDAFLTDGEATLRVVDVAERLKRGEQHVRMLLREERWEEVPPPAGRDDVGWWWTLELVNAWLDERKDRRNARQTADILGVSSEAFGRKVAGERWDEAPPPLGAVRGRRYWTLNDVRVWQSATNAEPRVDDADAAERRNRQ